MWVPSIICNHKLNNQNWIWNEIENASHKHSPRNYVQNSGTLVESCSIRKKNFFSLVNMLWRMVHNFFKLRILERFEVEVLHLHHHVKRNKMQNRMLDRMIKRKHVNVHRLAENSREDLWEAQHIADLWAIFDELVRLLIGELHDSESSLHLGRQSEVECHCAGELNEPQGMRGGDIWCIGSLLINVDGIERREKHREDHALDKHAGVEHLALFHTGDHVFFRVDLQVAENCHGDEILLVAENGFLGQKVLLENSLV